MQSVWLKKLCRRLVGDNALLKTMCDKDMSPQMVKLNEANHRVHCGVTGLPFPSVTWRAKGQNIRNNPDISSVESKYEVDGTDLLIRSVHN